VWESKISDYLIDSAFKVRFSSIRYWARVYMEDFDCRDKKCLICGYDKFVEVAHLKPICDFDEDDLMSEVNASENLEWFCPNHHIELHRGLMDKEDLKKLLSSKG
jgi:hypothetical protein